MPLTTDDSGGRTAPPGGETSFPAQPGPGTGGAKSRLLLWIFIAAVLASVIFLLLEFVILPARLGRDTPATPDTSGTAPRAQEPPLEAGRTDEAADRAAALRERLSRLNGDYTIFIGVLGDSGDAGELARRWEKAGYPAFVLPSRGGRYRVGLGRYPTEALAREDAEKLRQALEDGYWIGRAAF